jgi:hypothetical protein
MRRFIAKGPLVSTISPSRLLPDPAWLTAARLSAIDRSPVITVSQLAAKPVSAASRLWRVSRSSGSFGIRTFEACQRTVAVRSPSRSPNHL